MKQKEGSEGGTGSKTVLSECALAEGLNVRDKEVQAHMSLRMLGTLSTVWRTGSHSNAG